MITRSLSNRICFHLPRRGGGYPRRSGDGAGFRRAILLAGFALLSVLRGGGSGGGGAVPGNLVVNGSFEEPDLPPGISIVPAGDGNLPGWTFVNGNPIAIIDNLAVSGGEGGQAYWGPAGDQFVELDAAGNGGISQDVRTVPGASYYLRVAYRPKPGAAVDTCAVRLYRDEELIGTLPVPYSTFPGWVPHFLSCFYAARREARHDDQSWTAGPRGDGRRERAAVSSDYVDVIPVD